MRAARAERRGVGQRIAFPPRIHDITCSWAFANATPPIPMASSIHSPLQDASEDLAPASPLRALEASPR